MNFLKQNIRTFIQNEVEAVAMQIEEEDKIPKRIIEMSKEMGLFCLSIPEEYGGLGIGMVSKCALYEEIGQTHLRKFGTENDLKGAALFLAAPASDFMTGTVLWWMAALMLCKESLF